MTKFITSILFLFLFFSANAGDTVFVNNYEKKTDIFRKSSFYIDNTQKLDVQSFLIDSGEYKFARVGDKYNDFGISEDILWIKFILKNQTNQDQQRIIDIDYATLNKIELFVIRNGKLTEHQYSGLDYLYDKSKFKIRNPVFFISIPSNAVMNIFLRVETISIKKLPITLYSEELLIRQKLQDSFITTLLLGVILATFFFNVILFLIIRENMYLYFSLALFSILLYFSGFHGFLFDFDLGINFFWRTRLRFIGFIAASVFVLLFTIYFVEMKKNFRFGFYVFRILIVVFIVFFILVLIPCFSQILMNKISIILYPISGVIQLINGIFIIKNKIKSAGYLVFSYLFFMHGHLYHTLYSFGFIEYSFFIHNSTIIDMAIFSILITAGLNEKFIKFKQEKLIAEQINNENIQLQAEIKRRIKLSEELTMYKNELENLVQARTHESIENMKKYSELVEQIHDWLWQIDLQGNFKFSNKAVIEYLGLSAEDIIGSNFCDFFPAKYYNYFKGVSLETDYTAFYKDFECILHSANLKSFYVSNRVSIFYDETGKVSGYRGISRDITQTKNLENRLLKTVIETEEKERKRFAVELHDGLGATLSGINMYINAVLSENTEEQVKEELLLKVQTLIRLVSNDLREVAHNIRPHELSYLGLSASIENLIRRITIPEQIKVLTDFADFKINLDSDTELILYRVITELINNTIKHSGAVKIYIKIENSMDFVFIEYKDNGIGFDYEKIMSSTNKQNMGLQNIKNRLKAVNGTVEFISKENAGLSVHISVEIQNSQSEYKIQ